MERTHAQHHPARDHLVSRKYALRELFRPACARAARADLHLHREHIARRSKHHDRAIVASKVPHVICLLSAPRCHGLGTQLPGEVFPIASPSSDCGRCLLPALQRVFDTPIVPTRVAPTQGPNKPPIPEPGGGPIADNTGTRGDYYTAATPEFPAGYRATATGGVAGGLAAPAATAL